MTTKTFGRTGLVALAGLLMLAAAPSFAQTQSQTGSPQSQTTTPANPAGSSYQNSTGTMQNGAMQNGGSTYTPGTSKTAMSGESLSRVKNAKTTLASAQVQDSSGQQVGQVSTVHTSRSGHPTKIDITLTSTNGGQAKTVAVSASKLRYNKTNNTLITNLSATDLQAMPTATSSSM